MAGWLLLLAADLIVLTRGFPALCASVRACPVRRLFFLSPDVTPADILDALRRAHRLATHQYQCLKYSAAATWLLRLHGHPASMIIGVTQRPFRAHAWLECAGAQVAPPPEDDAPWTVLMRI
jgi:hypothetical protein